ncbi:MAG: DUF4292 domain-containing protein [Desulfarculaceae bacterium]|nr:DUF4292 domain-containing protein [Desulfarculaceae bacterium]MCF8073445.1 DUF4292 domain-containing protein [Desulfarculaceae bacterium]MCF8100408.1 DUF4292 domain-containing protein [Desulfarculaceae bacterium]MCF8115856.1 DUF4292 domain-containing protein [Desulfarculaceae bacterium]
MSASRAIGCALLALLLCLTITSCVHLPGGPTLSELPAPETARQGLENRRMAVKSFSMSGEIEVKAPQGELHGDHVIIGQAPDRLRAEVLGPFGQPLLRVVVDGRKLSVLSFRENRAYVGAATRENLARFLGLNLSPSEIFAVLIGAPPLLPAGSQAQVSPVEGGEGVLLRLVEPGRQVSQGLVFDQGDFAVHRAWLENAAGRMNLETSFGSLQKALTSRYPKRLQASDGQGRTLLITNYELKLNQSPDPALFETSLPPGLEVVPLP